MRTAKSHRYVSRTGPAGDAHHDRHALARAENEGWPVRRSVRAPRRIPSATDAQAIAGIAV